MSTKVFGLVGRVSSIKLLMSQNVLRKFALPPLSYQSAWNVQYSSDSDGTDSRFYCPPGSEEFCIAGHMPVTPEEEKDISNYNDICPVQKPPTQNIEAAQDTVPSKNMSKNLTDKQS